MASATNNITLFNPTFRFPTIDLGAGPFADSDGSIHPLDTISHAHIARLNAQRTLEHRILASGIRSNHANELARLTDEITQLKEDHAQDLRTTEYRFINVFGQMLEEKTAHVEEIKAQAMRFVNVQLTTLGEELARVQRQNGILSEALRLAAIERGRAAAADETAGASIYVTNPFDTASASASAAAAAAVSEPRYAGFPSTVAVAKIQNPNNVSRAKAKRLPSTEWSRLENLTGRAGGLPIRKERLLEEMRAEMEMEMEKESKGKGKAKAVLEENSQTTIPPVRVLVNVPAAPAADPADPTTAPPSASAAATPTAPAAVVPGEEAKEENLTPEQEEAIVKFLNEVEGEMDHEAVPELAQAGTPTVDAGHHGDREEWGPGPAVPSWRDATQYLGLEPGWGLWGVEGAGGRGRGRGRGSGRGRLGWGIGGVGAGLPKTA